MAAPSNLPLGVSTMTRSPFLISFNFANSKLISQNTVQVSIGAMLLGASPYFRLTGAIDELKIYNGAYTPTNLPTSTTFGAENASLLCYDALNTKIQNATAGFYL